MKHLSQNEQATLILILAIIFGAWLRIMPAQLAGFPINDGGMFYTMILDLQANHYLPPLFTSYNHLSIPFAYPPLGFYLGALLSDLFNVPPIVILRWLPGILNALTIPAFYFFAKEVLKDKFQSSAAALIFAFIPHLTAWESMGGGLTRSLGLLFMLLTLVFVQRVFEETSLKHKGHNGHEGEKIEGLRRIPSFLLKKDIWGAILFGGLTTLSHTEAPIYTIAIALLIWLVKSRSWKGLLNGEVIALGVLIIGGGWYGFVIYHHGLAPFQSISQTGAHSLSAIFRILDAKYLAEEPYLDLLGVLGILGIATLTLKKDYFLPLMLVVIFLAQPRSASIMANIPLAMAAGFFTTEILLPALSKINEKQIVFFVVLGMFIFSNSLLYEINLSRKILAETERTAMQWIQENTPKDSLFVVLSGDQNAFCDPITEWFPALTERSNATTIQGTEWLLGNNFGKNLLQSHRVQACLDEDLNCFTHETEKLGKPFDYVYVSISAATSNCGLAGISHTTRGLILSFDDSPNYAEVYRSKDVVIFEKAK